MNTALAVFRALLTILLIALAAYLAWSAPQNPAASYMFGALMSVLLVALAWYFPKRGHR